MAYRKKEHDRHHHERDLYAPTTPSDIVVTNGGTTRVAFPCWYYLPDEWPHHPCHHHMQDHDHHGWPNPDRPDWSCQIPDEVPYPHHHHRWFVDLDHLIPINLVDEGYEYVDVSFDTSYIPEDMYETLAYQLSATGEIDPVDTNLIRVEVFCNLDFRQWDPDHYLIRDKKPLLIPYTINAVDDGDNRNDVVATGNLVVMPSAYVEPRMRLE